MVELWRSQLRVMTSDPREALADIVNARIEAAAPAPLMSSAIYGRHARRRLHHDPTFAVVSAVARRCSSSERS